MSLVRVLEPELMDTAEEATDYDAMDHSAVNRLFVEDWLAAGIRYGPLAKTSEGASDERDVAPCIEEILDLGTGTAQIPIELCRRHAACRVMAVDAAVHMLDLARLNVELAGMTDRIALVHLDAKELPFSDAAFSAVISNSIVHHIPEPIQVLREAVRVTSAEGRLFFRDLLRPADEVAVRHLVETYAAGVNDHQQQMFQASLRAALSLEEIRALVCELGFDRDTVQPTSDRHWTWSVRLKER